MIERINSQNQDARMDEIADLGNAFLASLGENSGRDAAGDRAVIGEMVDAGQTEIFLAISDTGQAVGISYFNVGTGFSCGGNYIWINGIFVDPDHRRRGYASALLAEIEAFGETIGSRLIMSTRDIGNGESRELFSHSGYVQGEQVVIT